MKKMMWAAITAALLATVAACADTGGTADSEPKAEVPKYTVVERDTQGNQRNVVVEVDSTEGLRAVFDDVVSGLEGEAGYHVSINCSSGATKRADNRLANGRYAVGAIGSASTGLAEGEKDFSENDGRTCPA